jgi:hypothetical protein
MLPLLLTESGDLMTTFTIGYVVLAVVVPIVTFLVAALFLRIHH